MLYDGQRKTHGDQLQTHTLVFGSGELYRFSPNKIQQQECKKFHLKKKEVSNNMCIVLTLSYGDK